MCLHLSVSHSVHMGRGSLYDVTSGYLAPFSFQGGLCLWSHVPLRDLCPGDLPDRDPPGQRSPWIENPRQRSSGQRPLLDRDLLPQQRPTGQRHPPWTETHWTETSSLDRDILPGQRLPGQRPPGQRPPGQRDHCTVKNKDTCILLECILVKCYFLLVENKEASRLYAELLCRRCADDICHPPVKSHLKSHSRVVCTSSAHHLHIVHMSSARDFNPKNIPS